jgi:competence ComEA-like helix-hairpin-helix protein
MDKIPLRTYLKEIENLIEKGENDQAIAHCRHILKAYPKNLATYRLLGKAYLENRRYGDAADVFQRVLSGVPDDFVSHVGMSIIREDESNQDAAIWHMERAFEIQPYNSAIQDELRRLYGRRDGLEPPKVRLTRGALARMYARGNLYQQAIGELRAALAEDPKRSDLQVLLARMYFMAGQKVEAVETCSNLLKKLPYCLEANRIISAILPETERKEETQVYRERVMFLDPYLVLASPYETTSEGVRDQVVVIEKLDYQEGQIDEASQPAWAASLGVTFEEFKSGQEPVPDWLQAISEGQAPAGPVIPTHIPPEGPSLPSSSESPFLSESDELIPDAESEAELPSWISFPDQPSGKANQATSGEIPEWMKEAGWEASSGTGESGLPAFEYPEAEEIDDAEIEKGDLPPWLQSLAPEGADDSQPLSDEEALLASMPWLNDSASESEQAQQAPEASPDWLEEELGAKSGEALPETPEWLKELGEADLTGEPEVVLEDAAAAEEADQEVSEDQREQLVEEEVEEMGGEAVMEEPELEGFEAEESVPAEGEEEMITGQPEPQTEIPEWLQEVEGEEDSVPDELGAPEAEASAEVTGLAAAFTTGAFLSEHAEEEEGMPDWLKEEDESEEEQIPESELSTDEQESLAAIAATQVEEGTLSEEGEAEPTAFVEESEAFISEVENEEFITEEEQTPEVKVEAGNEGEGIPDWLKELGSEEPEQSLVEVDSSVPDFEEAVVAEEVPEWLQEIASEVAGVPAETDIEEEEDIASLETSDEIPDWLREFSQEGSEAKLDEIQSGEIQAGGLSEGDGIEPVEEIPAWLQKLKGEDLEQVQPEFESLSSLEFEAEKDATPEVEEDQDWLQIIGEEPLRTEPAFDQQDSAEKQDYSPEDLEALLADTQPVRITKEEPAVPFNEVIEEIDAGMQEIGEELEITIGDQESVAGETGVPIEGEIEGVEPGIFGAALAAAESEETPAIEEPVQAEAQQTQPVGDAVEFTPFEVDDQDAGMAWLESLAAKHGVSEEELFTNPEERPDALPYVIEAEEGEAEESADSLEPVAELETGEEPPEELEEAVQGDRVSEESLDWIEEAALAQGDLEGKAEIPDWLKELETVQEEIQPETSPTAEVSETPADLEAPTEVGSAEPTLSEEIPGWLREMQSEADEELSQQQAQADSIQEPVAQESDAAMAWLDGLAAKQGVPEGELFTKPEERLDTPPEWIEEKVEITEEAEVSMVEAIEQEAEMEETEEEPTERVEAEEKARAEEQIVEEAETVSEVEESADVASEGPEQVEEPELPEWLSETEEAEVDEVEWALPFEPVKAALREPRPGTAPLAVPPSQPVDINQAALVDLETLPGVGFILAQNILTYRDAFGPYADIEDLVKVPGITPSILAEIREYLTVPPVQDAPKRVEPELLDDAQASLLLARNKLTEGDVSGTIAQYSMLVKNPELLPEIIRDLKEALYRFPVDIGLWQTLGDAYMRNDQLSEALEAYTKAEELLR